MIMMVLMPRQENVILARRAGPVRRYDKLLVFYPLDIIYLLQTQKKSLFLLLLNKCNLKMHNFVKVFFCESFLWSCTTIFFFLFF